MTTGFKVFRFLTSLNLMISGFFLMMALLSVMFMASLSQGLVGLLVLGAVCIHSILSLYLQRSLQYPDMPLKTNTPGGIRIMGWIAIIYALSLLASCIFILTDKQDAVSEMVKQLPPEQQSYGAALMRKILTGFMVFAMLYSASILVNCFLSFSFLKQWQRRQETNDRDGFLQ